MKHSWFCIAACAAFPLAAHAQAPDGLLDVAGQWRSLSAPAVASEVSAARARELTANLTQFISLLRTAPVLAHPRGFVVVPGSGVSPGPYTADSAEAPGYGRGPLVGYASVLMLPYYRDAENGPPRVGGEGPSFSILANTLTCLYPGWKEPYAADAAGGMYVEPTQLGDVHGHHAYESSLGETCVVVTSRPVPMWVPVSRERLLRALIAQDKIHLDSASVPNPMIENMLKGAREFQRNPRPEIQKQGREMEAAIKAQMGAFDSAHRWLVDTLRSRLSAHERLLSAMSANERAAPAVVRNFALANDPFSPSGEGVRFEPTRIVAPNPDFFDKARPISAVQVVTFHADCKAVGCSAWGNEVRTRLLSELDWKALEALVH